MLFLFFAPYRNFHVTNTILRNPMDMDKFIFITELILRAIKIDPNNLANFLYPVAGTKSFSSYQIKRMIKNVLIVSGKNIWWERDRGKKTMRGSFHFATWGFVSFHAFQALFLFGAFGLYCWFILYQIVIDWKQQIVCNMSHDLYRLFISNSARFNGN